MRFTSVIAAILCTLPPLIALGSWAASERENLTKPTKNVQVETLDEVFGDRVTRTESRRGPVFGYFIGLDAVAGAALLSLIGGGVLHWRARRRRKSLGEQTHENRE